MTQPLLTDVAWSGGHLLLGDPDAVRRVRRKRMSASASSATLKCPASMAAGYLLPRVEDPFADNEIGTAMHAVFEDLYQLPAEERTPSAVDKLVLQHASVKWSIDQLARQTKDALRANDANRKRWVEIVGRLARGIFDIEDPTKAIVLSTEQKIVTDLAGGVPTICHVDRVDWIPSAADAPGAVHVSVFEDLLVRLEAELVGFPDETDRELTYDEWKTALRDAGVTGDAWNAVMKAKDARLWARKIITVIHDSGHVNGTIAVRDYKKGLALTTRVATPKGWTTVADLRVGDDVLAPNGLPTKVLSKSAVHDRPCYELTFSDGEKIVSDHVHDWVVSVMDASGAWSTKVKVEARALHDLMERLRVEGRTHSIVVENTAPIELPPAALPIDPYILGAWLGDGKSASSPIFSSDQDVAEMSSHLASRWDGELKVKRYANVSSPQIWLKQNPALCRRGHDRSVLDPSRPRAGTRPALIKRTGADGCRTCIAENALAKYHGRKPELPLVTNVSLAFKLDAIGVLRNKHVPVEYLRGSRQQRIELVRGLMDTDGSWNGQRKRAVFVNTNRAIADAMGSLLVSLGITVQRFTVGQREGAKESYRVEFTPTGFVPFHLSRKVEPAAHALRRLDARLKNGMPIKSRRRTITDIRPVASVPSQCIEVDSPEHMFLCGEGMVPTHNSNNPRKLKKPQLGHSDDYGDQQRLYTLAIEDFIGVRPAEAAILFPALAKQGGWRYVDISERELETTALGYHGSWELMNASADRAKFETRPGILCSWCDLVNSCPSANQRGAAEPGTPAEHLDKFQLARRQKPSAVDLGIPMIRPGAAPAEALSAPLPQPDLTPAPSVAPVLTPAASTGGTVELIPAHGDDLFPITLHEAANTAVTAGAGARPTELLEPAPAAAEEPGRAPTHPAAIPAEGGLGTTGGDGIPDPAQPGEIPGMWTENDPNEPQPRGAGMTENNIRVRPEGLPSVELVGDDLNLNSYAAIAVGSVIAQAYKHLDEKGVPIRPETLSRFDDVLTGVLLRAQYRLTGQVTFQAGAQSRLRGLLFTFMERRPFPFAKNAQVIEKWMSTAEQFLVVGVEELISLHERSSRLLRNDSHLFFVQDTPTETPTVQ
ncbi:PD-(D/E)XK nuclease family protein [Microbacterium xylanilyticum]